MPVSSSVTITGSSADFVVSASGSGFGIFSSYSTYASEALSCPSGSPVTGSGSFALSLDTSFGDLVFSGTDTIGASGAGYAFTGSESLAFVFGSDTLSFSTDSVSASGSLASLQGDINSFYSSITTINSILTLSDTVSAAAASNVASDFAQILAAASPTVAGASASITTNDGATFHFIKTS